MIALIWPLRFVLWTSTGWKSAQPGGAAKGIYLQFATFLFFVCFFLRFFCGLFFGHSAVFPLLSSMLLPFATTLSIWLLFGILMGIKWRFFSRRRKPAGDASWPTCPMLTCGMWRMPSSHSGPRGRRRGLFGIIIWVAPECRTACQPLGKAKTSGFGVFLSSGDPTLPSGGGGSC